MADDAPTKPTIKRRFLRLIMMLVLTSGIFGLKVGRSSMEFVSLVLILSHTEILNVFLFLRVLGMSTLPEAPYRRS